MIDLSTSTDQGDMVDETISYVKTVVKKKTNFKKGKNEKTEISTTEMI